MKRATGRRRGSGVRTAVGSDRELLRCAARAAERAYAPYSRFAVGAALLSAEGVIYTGCNVENASYGLTLCAERVAMGHAVASGARTIVKVAIVGGTSRRPAWPCGACRQVLAEFCDPATPVLVAGRGPLKGWLTGRLGDLLPQAFRLKRGTVAR